MSKPKNSSESQGATATLVVSKNADQVDSNFSSGKEAAIPNPEFIKVNQSKPKTKQFKPNQVEPSLNVMEGDL